jgi:fimbrial chaperone protein
MQHMDMQRRLWMTRLVIELFLFIGIGLTNSAHASFDFQPIIANLSPSGAGNTTSFTVNNYDDHKIPVQITIVPREPDVDGKEVYKESDTIDETFRVFPDQVVLNPKETRAIRVTYIGSPNIKAEQAYRIIAEELPVDVDDPKKKYTKAVARITISTKYVGSLYVTPAGTKPEMVIDAKRSETASKNMIVTLTNKGTAHQVIRKPTLKFKPSAGGKEIEVSGMDLKTMMNQNVLPGRVRQFSLVWPKELPDGPVKVTLDPGKE